MKIKEFDIHRYGPLAETGRVRLSIFNLFWGENEEGKTFTIEALVKLLLGKTRKLIADIDRVKEDPTGFIVMENGDGEEAKIPEQGRISDIVNLSAEECANLFIIRNSDLSITKESEFYGSVTERLTGLRSSQIQIVKKNLRSIAYLTDTLQTINTRETQYLSNRLKKGEQLLEKCEKLSKTTKAKEFDKIEEKLVNRKWDLDLLYREIQKQEKARVREKYEQGQENLKKLIDIRSKIKNLKNFSDKELATWVQTEQVIKEEQDQVDQFKKRLTIFERDMDQTENLLIHGKNELQVLKNKQTRIDETLKPLFREHGSISQKVAVNKVSKKPFQILISFVSIVLVLLFAGVILKPSLDLYLLSGIFFTAFIILSSIYFVKLIRPFKKLENCKQDIFFHVGEFGFTGNGIPELQIQIQRFEDALLRQEQKVNAFENHFNILRSKSLELRQEHLARSEQRLQKAQYALHDLKTRFGLKNLEEFQERLQERKKLERTVAESVSILKNLYGISSESFGEQIKLWQNQIDELEEFRKESPGVIFDEHYLDRKKHVHDKLEIEINEIQKQLEHYQESLGDIEREALEVLLLEENPYPCQNLNDLEIIISKLKEFIQKINDKQNLAKEALNIFSEIETEEIKKIGTLFGEDKPVSHYFSEITNSLYNEVQYDPSELLIQVKRQDGKMLQAKWLSGGAYDQLYFAIRLALGKELLQGQTGFFILDDPFIKADTGRLKRMMEILVEISRQGWQIIYFSAKDEILDVLKPFVDSEEISLHQVPKSRLLGSEAEK
jgi:exonuclease SbcC